MPLTSGTRLGPYEIVAPLGAGGMGEVYKARDTRLNRDVAIKALPDLFAQDAERVARFTREAQTLAALNHPNIAQIYGIESPSTGSGHSAALVMELVDGEDLSTLIARSAHPGSKDPGLQVSEALAIARQIADALEAAHDQGIVHRDLKPANIKVRPDGTVKVLDFGLAKAFDAAGAASGPSGASPSNSPTLTAAGFAGGPGTQMGMILGTAAYMAPEQARGKVVDRRADIWAFGVVLLEMLTGRRTFAGEEVSDVLAAVLRQDIDFTSLPATTPSSVRRLLKRCLERDPRKRLSAIGDARLDIDESDAPAAPAGSTMRVQPSSLVARLWPALVGVALTAIVAYALWPSAASTPSVSSGRLARLSILPPSDRELVADSTGVAISPDGTMVAFVTGNQSGADDAELWVRSLDSRVARRLDETVADAALPFWSPDSRRVGFSSTISSKLKTVAVTGGRSDVIADAQTTRGAVWTASNTILFALAEGPLKQVAATGGTPAPATILDPDKKELSHRFPSMLPDGDHFLYVALPSRDGKFDVFVGSLSDKSLKTKVFVGALDSAPVYAPAANAGGPGYLLYGRQGALAAVPFDAKTLTIKGDPILLEDEPVHVLDPAISFTAGRSVTVSDDGSLAYFAAASTNTVASWLDMNGSITGTLNLPPGHYDAVAISPDGKRGLAVRSASAVSASVWLVDLARGTSAPFSTGPGRNDSPVWSPDGLRAIFASDRSGFQQFFTRNLDDAAPETEWYRSDTMFKMPFSFSVDRSLVVMNTLQSKTMHDILAVDAAGKQPPKILVDGPLRDIGGWVSPDNKWLAYASETGGSLEVWVQSFPTPGRRVQISDKGGALAWWGPGGRQLIWIDSDFRSLWRADVVPGATFSVQTPVKFATLPAGIMWMDAMPDRQRFLVIAPERSGAGSVMVVQNWRKALEGKK